MRNSYSTLGLRRDAGAREIARAYRQLVRQYHPDVSGASRDTVELFLAVQEAYEVLSDPQRRTAHDGELDQLEQRLRATVAPPAAPPADPEARPYRPPPAGARPVHARVDVPAPRPRALRSTVALVTASIAAALLPASLILADTVPAAPRLAWAVGGSLLGLLGSVAARSLATGETERLWRRTMTGGPSPGGPAAVLEARRLNARAVSVSLLGRRFVLVGIPCLLMLASR